jgi:ferric-dicitrate binding protein FerR (iron transport regulator)
LQAKNIKQLLRQYLLGKAPEKESGVIDQWYDSFNEDLHLSKEQEEQLRQEMWQHIHPQIKVAKTFYLGVAARAAAVALLLAGAGLTYFLLREHPAKFTEIITQSGEKKTVTLPDGTILSINAGSTIRITAGRTLSILDGEVFFDVKGDPRKAFTVQSGPLTTTVLGTSFNITAYKALHNLSVGVVSGKVSVNGYGILAKNQALVYDKQTGTGKIDALDQNSLEWQHGKLLLNDVSFDEMVVMMQKNFGITITANQEEVKATRYTTELSTVMEPVKAAEVLAAIHQLKIKATTNQILIYK